jgi:hypothetical protein
MPKVVELVAGIALLGAGIGFAVAGVALFGLSVAATAISVISVGANLIIGGAVGMLAKPPSLSSLTQQGNTVTIKQAAATRVTIYGRMTLGGIITYIATTGANNEFMHLVVTFTGHEVDAIEAIYFDQYALVLSSGYFGNETSQYNGFLSVESKLGAAGEAAFAGLIADTSGLGASAWTSSCRQDGCCSIHFKLKWDQAKWPNGVPNIRAKIRGKKVFDPRSSTTAWSNNWALCVRDWMIDPVNGLKCAASEINDTLLNAAANLSDEAVALLAGGTEPRYTCNGSYDTSKTRGTVISALLTAGAGRLAPCGGQWNLYGGAWRAPSLTLGDDDLRGGLQLTARKSRRDLASGVKGDFVDPNNDWQTASFPGMVFASYVADDSGVPGAAERGRWLTATGYSANDAVMSNGFAYVCTSPHTSGASTQPGVGASWPTKWNLAAELNWKTVSYPFTTSAATAQRLAKIDLETVRRQIALALPAKLGGYLAQPPEVLQFTHSDFAWTNKTFEIVQCDLVPGSDGAWGVDFSLQESDANVYAWSTAFEQAQQAIVNVSVADPKTVQPVSGIALTSGASTVLVRGDGVHLSRIQVTWTQPADQFVVSGGKIFCEYQVHNSGNWRPAFEVDGATTIGFIQGVSDGVAYDVRMHARNVYDVYSADVQVSNHTVTSDASNVSYRPLSNPLTATDAGASDTVSIAAFTMRVGGNDVAVNSGSIASLSRKTLYFIYYTDPALQGSAANGGAGVSFTASTTKETALSGSGKFFVGSIPTPGAGSVNTVGNNDGGSGAQDGDTFIMTPQIYSVTAGQWLPVGLDSTGAHDGFSSNAVDGDSSSFGNVQKIGGTGDLIIIFGGFPAFTNRWSSLKLNVKSSGSVSNNAGNTLTVDYSVDGGATYTTIWTIGANATHAASLDTFSLTLPLPLGNVLVRFTLHTAGAGSVSANIYEMWLEGQL